MARKAWTVLVTCLFADAVIAEDGRDVPADKRETLRDAVNYSPGAAEATMWRMQTALGYLVAPADISALDQAVARLFLEHDPRLRRQVNA